MRDRREPPSETLALTLEREATLLRRRGIEGSARLLESVAAEVRTSAEDWLSELLTYEEASRESGYSVSALRRAVERGELHDHGEPGRPRLVRHEIPLKPRARSAFLLGLREAC